ncbi:hypothetical protein [Schaalia hyovaginalis]|uniref:hypothetical protein n=1 Tax=Schaalia hyovaginalis TaxID=29316 RepID=UPI0026F11D6E|nr:hypothetical protein [Schaalia hyovaginalis]MCI7513475.1 hypothetical protein [Schaalia hyovaginalis]MDY3666347.1 hypothetical protein [Schaalia hyovaginalis]MDY4491563.1 hypothetical protein [Schaalia hyovaginalis]
MTDPVDKLLHRDEHREDMLRTLGLKLSTLLDVTDEYRAAWRAATGVGWAKGDLLKAGFVDPTRLPRRSTPRRIETEH